MEWIDIGANLAHESFAADRDAVLARAREAGVTQLVITGSSVASATAAQRLAAAMPDRLASTAGIHPHHASDCDADALDALRTLSTLPGVVAIGECGLDYYRNLSPRDAQLAAFRRQLELAVERQLPVFLHERDAHEDFLALLREYRGGLISAVSHCFTGGPAEVDRYLELDLHIGITGWLCDERRGSALRAAAPRVPAGRLMIETDAPYLLPRSLRPAPKTRRNEPAWLVEVGRVLADLRDETPESLAAHTTATARAFFGLTPGTAPRPTNAGDAAGSMRPAP